MLGVWDTFRERHEVAAARVPIPLAASGRLRCDHVLEVFVQVLDSCFENVCELDLIYHFDRVLCSVCMAIAGVVVLL